MVDRLTRKNKAGDVLNVVFFLVLVVRACVAERSGSVHLCGP